MDSLFPSTLLLTSPKPHQSLRPLQSRPPTNSFNPFGNKLSGNAEYPRSKAAQFSTILSVSASELTNLFNDWPQLLQHSIGSKNLVLGKAIHAFLVKWGSHIHVFEGNNLVNLYSKFNRLDDAQRVFDGMPERNTITWTSLIKGCLESNDVESVFLIGNDMHRLGEKFNEHSCSVILQACSLPKDRIRGEQIHGLALKSGFEENVFVGTSLITMYSRSGYLGDAEKVFNDIADKDVRCLNYMILEYGKAGNGEKSIWVFINLISFGMQPNDYTFTNILSVCNGDIGVEEGRQLHGLAFKCGFVDEISVGNAVITMYGRHGMVEEAEKMFSIMSERNLVSWTALLSAYGKNGYADKALYRFLDILNLGILCDSSCLATMLDNCSESKNLKLGHQIHGFVIKFGYLPDVNIGTALVDLYAKFGNLQSARLVFDGIWHKNTASLNAILVGFMETNGDDEEDAMALFSQLRLAGSTPDLVTFSRLLSLSANQACLVKGKSLQAYAIKTGFEADTIVGNAVITMYAKCGSIEDALQMFNGMYFHDAISWNAVISAYALHGQGNEALLLFEEMKRQGYAPDKITILTILQSCCYCGLCEYGICLFNEMERQYGIKPAIEHFACMVDLLGRAGNLSEAMDFINKSPFSDSPLLWRTLVNGCKLRGDLNFGMLASKHLLDLAPEEAGSYILVSNMYAGEGMLDEAAKVRTAMNDLKVSKEAGSSWIEIDNKVHQFVASCKNHPKSREIYAELDLLRYEMKWKDNYRTDLQQICEPVQV